MSKSSLASHEGQSLLVTIPDREHAQKMSGKGSLLYGSVPEAQDSLDEHKMFVKGGRRLHSLDIARIVCVGLVAVNHGGESWSDQFGLWNEMYVQQWVLQWLFIICGISFGMSSRNTYGYLVRLAGYFVIGVFTNWCAYVIKGLDWKTNFWDVIFQFWFIFGLMIYIICLAPLKCHLRNVSTRGPSLLPDQELGLAHGLATIIFALVLVHFGIKFAVTPAVNWTLGRAMVSIENASGAGAKFWGMPSDLKHSFEFLEDMLGYVQVSIGSIVILWLFPRVSNRLPLTNWLVLLNIYAFKCFMVRGQFARIIDGFDFTMIGLANYYLGLSYRRTIGKYMVRYWFVMLFIFSLLIPPGTWGRFDEHTINDLSMRMRYHLVELALAILFLCAAERIADGEIFGEDKLEWLSWWALYLFLFHKFIHIVVPHPLNWVALLLLMPITWAIHGGAPTRGSQPDSQAAQAVPGKQDNVEGASATPPPQAADVERPAEEGCAKAKDKTLLFMDPESEACSPELLVSQIEGR